MMMYIDAALRWLSPIYALIRFIIEHIDLEGINEFLSTPVNVYIERLTLNDVYYFVGTIFAAYMVIVFFAILSRGLRMRNL